MKNGKNIQTKGNNGKGRAPVRKIVDATPGAKEKARIDKVVADDIAKGNGIEKPVETKELTPAEKLAELTEKLKSEKERIAKLKTELKNAKKAVKVESYSRFKSLADAMKELKTYDQERLAIRANRLFVEHGGADSMAQSIYFAKKVIDFAKAFEIVESLTVADEIVADEIVADEIVADETVADETVAETV